MMLLSILLALVLCATGMARGGFTVDITWKEGRMVSARIVPDAGGKAVVRWGDKRKSIRFRAGKAVELK
jgi:alpha-L-fucosidase 2